MFFIIAYKRNSKIYSTNYKSIEMSKVQFSKCEKAAKCECVFFQSINICYLYKTEIRNSVPFENDCHNLDFFPFGYFLKTGLHYIAPVAWNFAM